MFRLRSDANRGDAMKQLACTMTAALCCGLLLLETACIKGPPPLAETHRAQINSIGLVSARFAPAVGVLTPAKGALAGAGRKSTRWAMDATVGMMQGGSGGGEGAAIAALIWLVLATTVVTVAAVSGLVAGAIEAEPKKTIKSQESEVRAALLRTDLHRLLGERVACSSANDAGRILQPLDIAGPEQPRQMLAYADLAGTEIDSVVEISVDQLQLNGEWDVNPKLAIFLSARVRLVRVRDGKTLYHEGFHYQGEKRLFSEWSKDNAAQLSGEINAAFNDVAAQMSKKLFLEPWPEKSGQSWKPYKPRNFWHPTEPDI